MVLGSWLLVPINQTDEIDEVDPTPHGIPVPGKIYSSLLPARCVDAFYVRGSISNVALDPPTHRPNDLTHQINQSNQIHQMDEIDEPDEMDEIDEKDEIDEIDEKDEIVDREVLF